MILYGSRVAGLANGREGQANEEKTNRQRHSKTIHGESPLLIRLSLVRLRCIVRLRLVGVLLLTSKIPKIFFKGLVFFSSSLSLASTGSGGCPWPAALGGRF